jgi:large subunit ribosomal protein L31e
MSEPAEERIYTVPLGRAWVAPRYRRAEKAVTVLRKFVQRHMKPEEVVIEPAVNEAIWARGIKTPRGRSGSASPRTTRASSPSA